MKIPSKNYSQAIKRVLKELNDDANKLQNGNETEKKIAQRKQKLALDLMKSSLEIQKRGAELEKLYAIVEKSKKQKK